MRRLAGLVLVFLNVLSLCTRLRADEEAKWESHGPYGGLAFTIQVDETDSKRVLVCVVGGTFLSNDAGASWKRVIPPEGTETYMNHIRLIGGKFYCPSANTMYVSNDSISWKKEAQLTGNIYDIIWEPGKPDKKWCLSVKENEGKTEIYLATTKGDKWEEKKVGELPVLYASFANTFISVSPVDSSIARVFLVLFKLEEEGYTSCVFGSDDGGKTWEHWEVDGAPFAVAFSPTEPKTIYGAVPKQSGKASGLVKSVDGGKVWQAVSDDARITSLRSLMFHPKTGALFLGSTENGLFKTTDFGKTLTELNKGLFNKNVSALAADPTDEKVLYAGTQCGTFKSVDGGENWKWISEGIEGCQITDIVTFSDDPKRICVFEYHQGIRISTDAGATWSAVTVDWTSKYGKVWGNVSSGGRTVVATTYRVDAQEVIISRDMGQTWQTIKELSGKYYLVAVVSDNELYAIGEDHILLKSEDGVSWKPYAGPFDDIQSRSRAIAKPKGKDYLLIVGDEKIGMCESATGKRIRSIRAPEGEGFVGRSLLFDPVSPEVFYTGTLKGEIYKCDSSTEEWTKLYAHKQPQEKGEKTSTETEIVCISILFDPLRKQRILAGFTDGSIIISEDSGKSWKPLTPKVPSSHIWNMAVTSNGILVVTIYGAVYTLDLSRVK